MKRKLLSVCSGLSLLLCVAACTLWAWSYVRPDGWRWSDGVRVPTAGYQVAWRSSLVSHRGNLMLIRDRSMGAAAHSSRVGRDEPVSIGTPLDTDRRLLGIGFMSGSGYPLIASTAIGPPVVLTRVWVVPWWAVVLITGVLPAARALSWRRRRRRVRRGACVYCGYDLRATPDRCPECGRAAA